MAGSLRTFELHFWGQASIFWAQRRTRPETSVLQGDRGGIESVPPLRMAIRTDSCLDRTDRGVAAYTVSADSAMYTFRDE